MAKFYFKNARKKDEAYLQPQEQTIDFLLNYSKSLNVIEVGTLQFETSLN
ncbi:hypothetical protein [Aquimarina intermedia]|uniref:Uncharacterized protein n=1 Tax=Aquimarina intermedia TaxID=350814 RepID=A0A5S5C9D8_9FLAO|nr:hypothetical protein [Aquimarina intermedia]TYP74950.1 hypothetical protein BD809_10312 [Aquimarina intermedia]